MEIRISHSAGLPSHNPNDGNLITKLFLPPGFSCSTWCLSRCSWRSGAFMIIGIRCRQHLVLQFSVRMSWFGWEMIFSSLFGCCFECWQRGNRFHYIALSLSLERWKRNHFSWGAPSGNKGERVGSPHFRILAIQLQWNLSLTMDRQSPVEMRKYSDRNFHEINLIELKANLWWGFSSIPLCLTFKARVRFGQLNFV